MQLEPSPPRPIVQISALDQILFAELIQSGSGRLSWIRPLFLVISGSVWDLKLDSDILWHGSFEFAYAEEVLPLYFQAQPTAAARQLVQTFLKLACRL